VVSTGVATPESFGLDNPETTPLSIPTNPATPPEPTFGNGERGTSGTEGRFAEQDSNAKPSSGSSSDASSEAMGQWYYSESGKRVGPISQDTILSLLQSKKLSPSTMVWRAGMQDWVAILHSDLAKYITADSPPPLSAKHIANGYAWALALAPVWATALHYILAYAYIEAKYEGILLLAPLFVQEILQKTWYFGWIVNVIMAFLDNRALKAAGWSTERINSWMIILIPVYLYKRDQMLGAGMTRFWVWIAAFIVSLLPIW
jgi:hypothetical protein